MKQPQIRSRGGNSTLSWFARIRGRQEPCLSSQRKGFGCPKNQPSLSQVFTREKELWEMLGRVMRDNNHQLQGRIWVDMRDLLLSLRINNCGNRLSREVPQSWKLSWPDRKELPGLSSVPTLLQECPWWPLQPKHPPSSRSSVTLKSQKIKPIRITFTWLVYFSC